MGYGGGGSGGGGSGGSGGGGGSYTTVGGGSAFGDSSAQELPSLNQAPAGSIRFNTDSKKLEVYILGPVGFGTTPNGIWMEVDSWSPDLMTGGTLGIIAGGWTNPAPTDIDKIIISTTGNSVDYGDLSVARYAMCSASDRTRGVFAGGRNDPSPAAATTTTDFIAIASGGTATSFGSLVTAADAGTRGNIGNSTRGIFARLESDEMRYITIQSTGNAVIFGDLIDNDDGGSGATCSSTRGLVFGGTPRQNIDYITTATLGHASDFGDLTIAVRNSSGNSNAVRSVMQLGTGPSNPAGVGSNIMEYVTTATLGNSKDFGDCAAYRSRGCCSSPTRGVFVGGADPQTNIMDYVQIMTTGNAIDFGDLDRTVESPGSCSNGHGGL